MGVLVATGHILYHEQEITSRPEKLAIRRRRSTDQLGLFYYEVEHVIENANPADYPKEEITMFTVRPTVFETNSSSEHCLTVEDGMRDIDEFPVPDDAGMVHIPLIGNADDLTETKDFVSLVQYLSLCRSRVMDTRTCSV